MIKNKSNHRIIWYALCTMLLGLIDQRRGSARGDIQMMFANLTGIVLILMSLTEVDLKAFLKKRYAICAAALTVASVVGILLGDVWAQYRCVWNSAVIAIASWLFMLFFYWTEPEYRSRAKGLLNHKTLLVAVFMILMFICKNESLYPYYYTLIFGGFLLFHNCKKDKESFWLGLLWGFVGWFFVQQTIAFGFRPYDYVSYKGLYAGLTQNAYHYAIVYTAVLLLLYLEHASWNKLLNVLMWLLAAGLVAFTIFTGRQHSLLGEVVVTLIVLIRWYWGTQRGWLRFIGRGFALCTLIIAMIIPVYCCIRYLPTILHHPIWFEGEYNEETSVRSFDGADSDRYISLEQALTVSVANNLRNVGVDTAAFFEKLDDLFVIHSKAAERLDEPGSSRENPYLLEHYRTHERGRESIWSYNIHHLTWMGHPQAECQYWIRVGTQIQMYTKAHNMFLQILYEKGIVCGVIFIILWIMMLVGAVRARSDRREREVVIILMVLATTLGLFENVLTPCSITLIVIGLLISNYCLEQKQE